MWAAGRDVGELGHHLLVVEDGAGDEVGDGLALDGGGLFVAEVAQRLEQLRSQAQCGEPAGGAAVAFVPEKLVVGPAFAIAAPFNRAKRLREPATFAGVPPPKDPAPDKPTIQPAGVSCG